MVTLGLVRAFPFHLVSKIWSLTASIFPVQALPFSDALKLISYLKDWTSNPDKVGFSAKSGRNIGMLEDTYVANASNLPINYDL